MSKNLVFLVMGILLLLMTIMGVGFFALWSRISSLDRMISPQSQEKSNEIDKRNKKEYVAKPKYHLETFIVNLADPKGKRYLRLTMDLEMEIRNTILMIIPTRTVEDIQSLEGKIALRDEIMTEMNNILKTGRVTNIYFTEFVVQ